MPVSASVLTQDGTTADQTSYTTASVTLTANRLYLLGVGGVLTDSTPLPTITSSGATWAAVAGVSHSSIASPDVRTLVFRTMVGSDQTGAITIDYGASTMEACNWILTEWTGIDTGGTNGSGAIVQSATARNDSATSIAVTLAAFADAVNNAAFGLGCANTTDAITLDSSPGTYTALGDQTHAGALLISHIRGEYRVGEDTSVAFATASTRSWGAVAIEIKAAASTGALALLRRRHTHGD
jgi:hypothetical protein